MPDDLKGVPDDPESNTPSPECQREFETLLAYLKSARGFDFTGYKRASLMRRVLKRMDTVAITGYAAYIDYLEVHPDEFAHLFNVILINVTSFFRDPGAWDVIAQEIIPRLLATKDRAQPIRVWSAGCASGQEAYTLAMALAEALDLSRSASLSESDLLPRMHLEMSIALEELQVAEEEMRAQNEALVQALVSLEDERQRYLELFDWAPDGYLVTDLNGAIREANQAASRLLGVAARYLTGKPLASYIAANDTCAFRERLSEAQKPGAQGWEGQEWELELRPRHAAPFPAALTVGVTRDAQERPQGLRWLVRDISERKQAQAAREKLQADLERERHIAETLQRSLLPDLSEARFSALSVATFYEAALDEAEIGGDFYDVFTLGDGKIALIVGDVSGKGLAAAAHMAEIKYTLRAFLREDEHPDKALAHLNAYLCDAHNRHDWEEDAFVVLSLAVVDPLSGETEMSVAGAEPILLLRPSDIPEKVEAQGLLVGIRPDAAYTQICYRLMPGETLLMATDGITEARQGKLHFLGIEGLQTLARDAQERDTLHGIGQAILDGAHAFAGGSLRDDACVLLARLNSPP